MFSLEFEVGRAILVALALISAGPLALRIFHRLNISVRSDIRTRASFWIIITSLPVLLVLQPFKLNLPEFLQEAKENSKNLEKIMGKTDSKKILDILKAEKQKNRKESANKAELLWVFKWP